MPKAATTKLQVNKKTEEEKTAISAAHRTAVQTGAGIGVPLFLRRMAASTATPAMIQRQPIEEEELLQAKLKVGQPNDVYEQEADRVADMVMRMPETMARKKERTREVNNRQALSSRNSEILYLQSVDENEEGYTEEYFGREALEGIRARATARHFYASAYVATSQRLIREYRQRLMAMQGRYERAYERYSTVISLAREEARNQEEWIDIFVGIGIGTVVGVVALFVAPEAAAAITVAVVAKEALSEFVEEVVENIGTQVTEATGLTDVAGRDLQPDPDLNPVILEMDIWRNISRLYRDVLKVQESMSIDFMLNGAAEYAIGEIKAFVGGAEPDMTEDELFELISDLYTIDQHLSPVLPELESKMATIRELETQEIPVLDYSVDDIEHDIWIMWIASISMSESDILDLDAIEDYLDRKGINGPYNR